MQMDAVRIVWRIGVRDTQVLKADLDHIPNGRIDDRSRELGIAGHLGFFRGHSTGSGCRSAIWHRNITRRFAILAAFRKGEWYTLASANETVGVQRGAIRQRLPAVGGVQVVDDRLSCCSQCRPGLGGRQAD